MIVEWRFKGSRLAQLGGWIRARPLVADTLFAVAIGLPLIATTLFSSLVQTPRPSPLLLLFSGVIVGHAGIALRRTAPLTSFAIVSTASTVMALGTNVFTFPPSLLIFPLGVYAYCVHGSQRWSVPAPIAALLIAIVGSIALTVRFAIDKQSVQQTAQGSNAPHSLVVLGFFGFILASVLVAWSLGLFRRVQLAYVAALEDRAVRAEAEREERARLAALDERGRIAREMHDVIAHSLSVIVSQAQGGQYAARKDPERATEVLATIASIGREALTDMRGLLGVMRGEVPPVEEEPWTPQPTLLELPELLDRVRGAGLNVQYHEIGHPRRLGPAAELALYRLVQEALTNTLKHAGAGSRTEVRFEWAADALAVTVSDNGTGPASNDGGGQGLVGMRERLAVVGGSVSAGAGPQGGFVVHARLLLHAPAVDEVSVS